MKAPIVTRAGLDARAVAGRAGKAAFTATAVAMLTGCVQVAAPERPIEINLNINIRQEVVVRLQEDARELIERNPGVF